MALMLWLPVMVQSLLSGGDPTQLVSSTQHGNKAHSAAADTTGVLPVLLTAVPFTCAAVLTTGLGVLAQRTGRPLVYNFTPNLIGGSACVAFPWVVHQNRLAGFAMLTVALACGYSSSPHPMTAITQITAATAAKRGLSRGRDHATPADAQGTALALPLYNTVAMLGGFFGPWLLGVAVERLGGFGAGTVAMGACMLAAGCLVLLLWCLHPPTSAGVAQATDVGQHAGTATVELMHPCCRSRRSLSGRTRPSDEGSSRIDQSSQRPGKVQQGLGCGEEAEQLLHEAAAAEECLPAVLQDHSGWRAASSPRVRSHRGRRPSL